VPADDVDGLVLDSTNGDEVELPAEQGLGSLLSKAAGLRKNRAWRQLAAAVAAGLVVGAGATAAARTLAAPAHGAASSSQAVVTVRGSNPQTAASATVRYTAQPWGVELYVQVSGVPTGTTCAFMVTDSRGRAAAAGSWTIASGQQDNWYPASSSVRVSGLRSFILTAAGKTLVRVPVSAVPTRTGGSR
jgi:hypothetical protein